MTKHRSRNWLLGAAGAGTIAVTLLSATISTGASASPAVHQQARPHAVAAHRPGAKQALRNGAADTSYPVTGVSQQFTFNTNGFCTGAPNAALRRERRSRRLRHARPGAKRLQQRRRR